jgi:hypothetical protein
MARRCSAAPVWSANRDLLAVPLGPRIDLWRPDLGRLAQSLNATYRHLTQVAFARDGELLAGLAGERLHFWETDSGRLRGILLPAQARNSLAISAEGHHACSKEVERGLVMVVQKEDGTGEVLAPAEFARKYGFKNEPGKVHLQPPPPTEAAASFRDCPGP